MRNLILLTLILALTSCATIRNNSEALVNNVDVAVEFVATQVLNKALSPEDRVEKAKWIYSIANAVYTLMDGKIHTPEEVKAVVTQFVPKKQWWTDAVSDIVGFYGVAYMMFKGDTKLAADVLNQIAKGASDAAKPYIK